jgi:glycosyltransferase involved in cell wall biosynthesis
VYNVLSNHQGQKYPPHLKRTETVYNAIDASEYNYEKEGNFWLYFSRCSPQKGSHLIPKIAEKTGARILMCCKVDDCDDRYYKKEVKPFIDKNWDEIKVPLSKKIQMIINSKSQSGVEWLDEVDVKGKKELFTNCKGQIFPLQWSEPFGITPLEAAASGKMTLAFPFGALPETVVHGKTGFLCGPIKEMNNPRISSIEVWRRYGKQAWAEMINTVKKVDKGELTVDPQDCIEHAKSFSVDRMVSGYEEVYEQVCKRERKRSLVKIS